MAHEEAPFCTPTARGLMPSTEDGGVAAASGESRKFEFEAFAFLQRFRRLIRRALAGLRAGDRQVHDTARFLGLNLQLSIVGLIQAVPPGPVAPCRIPSRPAGIISDPPVVLTDPCIALAEAFNPALDARIGPSCEGFCPPDC